jgi:hypothetical protein
MYSLALIIFVVSEKKAFEHFTIGSNVNNIKWKMAATAGLSLTLDPMEKVSQNASSLKPLGQFKPNEHFPIGSNVNLCPAVVAILDFRSA